jgi:hypothetical protein
MEKNRNNKWTVFAYGGPGHASVGLPITGIAANITANIRIDGLGPNAIDDVNPTELEEGYYVFDITAAESNGDLLTLIPSSNIPFVIVLGVPGAMWTRPANFNDFSVDATTGRVDVQKINGATIVGDGNATPWDGA